MYKKKYKLAKKLRASRTSSSRLGVYMDFLDALREVRRRSESVGPSLVHEQWLSSERMEEKGSFSIDENVGNNTDFQLYTMGPSSAQGYVKGIMIKDIRQKKYNKIIDRLYDHQLSVAFVPFDDVSFQKTSDRPIPLYRYRYRYRYIGQITDIYLPIPIPIPIFS